MQYQLPECSQLGCICHMLPTIMLSAAPVDLLANLDMATHSVLSYGFLRFSKIRDSNSIVLFPSIQSTQGSQSQMLFHQMGPVGCPDSLHWPSPEQQSNAIKISLLFPLSLNLACEPQMIPIVNLLRKWTVERSRTEERGEKEHMSLLLRNLEALGGRKDCVGSTLLVWWARIWALGARLSS